MTRSARRRFDHLHAELSVAVGAAVPRYQLWLWMREHGREPEHLPRREALAFCDEELDGLLRTLGLVLPRRRRSALRRRIAGFDARHPTPEERLASLTG